jgi:UDP-N-acetylglucosamine 2-epimerase (non-hydrolysing)
MKRKLLAVFGARPEAIKMCPLVRALQGDPRFCCEVCFSGQHREMLYEVTALFGVRAEYELFAMERESLADRQAYLLRELDRVMGESAPHLVLVHGDTLTAQTAALAAFYRRLPIGHVEAGLRTYHLDSPFPEEMNRRVIGLVAAYHFAPTERATANLLAEGVDPRAVSVTGNTVCDALAYTAGCSGALDWPDARAVCSRWI